VTVELFAADAEGRPVGAVLVAKASPAPPARIEPGRQASLAQTLTIPAPRLWSLKERKPLCRSHDGERRAKGCSTAPRRRLASARCATRQRRLFPQ